MRTVWELYLDESGKFEDTNLARHKNVSLVGGYLCTHNQLAKYVLPVVPDEYHGTDKNFSQKSEMLHSVMVPIHEKGIRYVVFENKEKINVVNGNITYLNILAEGICKLMYDLSVEAKAKGEENPVLNLTIAERKNVGEEGIIEKEEYYQRFSERMAMTMGRSGVNVCTLGNVEFKDARKCKELNLADMVCNIRLVRTNHQFSDEDKKIIESLYYKVYPVFESSGSAAIKRQIEENRLSEAIYQLCASDNFAEKKARLQDAITHIAHLPKKQLDNVLQSMSLELDNYTTQHDSGIYIQGIKLAENFKKMFLEPLKENGSNVPTVLFHIFDTDFYVLTIYDHLGNTAKCNEYLEKCQQNIGFISSSAEHLDYYFNFCIRRLNMIKDNFDFETALQKCRTLEKTLSDMKEWYSAVETEELGISDMKYPLLGKVYGIEVQTLTNLLNHVVANPIGADSIGADPIVANSMGDTNSQLLAAAEEASDKAIAEFTDPGDLSRQYMYRCQLYCQSGCPGKALQWLCKSCGISNDVGAYQKLLDYAFENGRVNVYVLLHYTNTMAAFSEKMPIPPEFTKMMDTLTRHKIFNAEIKQHDEGYPWNVINFNMYRAFCTANQPSAAEKYYKKALEINEKNPDNTAMLSFSVAFRGYAALAANHIVANPIPKSGKKPAKNTAPAETPEMALYKAACTSLFKKNIPQSMR